MERGLYIAAAGMVAVQARQELVANDLANASTPGYKAERGSQSAFGEMLLNVGPMNVGVRLEDIVTDTTQGAIKKTGERLDFAVAGDGFFAVQTQTGVRYTRNGRFAAGADGMLVAAFGNHVLGAGSQPIRPGATPGVFAVTNIQKAGDSLYTGTAGGA